MKDRSKGMVDLGLHLREKSPLEGTNFVRTNR